MSWKLSTAGVHKYVSWGVLAVLLFYLFIIVRVQHRPPHHSYPFSPGRQSSLHARRRLPGRLFELRPRRVCLCWGDFILFLLSFCICENNGGFLSLCRLLVSVPLRAPTRHRFEWTGFVASFLSVSVVNLPLVMLFGRRVISMNHEPGVRTAGSPRETN